MSSRYGGSVEDIAKEAAYKEEKKDPVQSFLGGLGSFFEYLVTDPVGAAGAAITGTAPVGAIPIVAPGMEEETFEEVYEQVGISMYEEAAPLPFVKQNGPPGILDIDIPGLPTDCSNEEFGIPIIGCIDKKMLLIVGAIIAVIVIIMVIK